MQILSLERKVRQLQSQASRQQLAADHAFQSLHWEMRSRRESLAGDLEGATTAMQDAARRLAAAEDQVAALQQELLAGRRVTERLSLDCEYLRRRLAQPKQQRTSQGRALSVVQALSMTIPAAATHIL